MTETRLLDYSFSRPTVAQVKASGAVGVLRYLCRVNSPKRLTASEAKQLRAAGLWIGVVFEDGATRARDGAGAGHDDAVLAAAQATAIGVPTSCPIFFAVDEDTTPGAVAAYFRGIASARIAHPVGVYGSISVVDGTLAAGLAAYGWQAGAWSHGQVSSKAHLYQRIKATHPVNGTDENALLRPLPLWGAPSVAPAVKPTPAPAPAPTPIPQPVTHQPSSEDADMLIVKNPNGPDWWVVRADLSGRSHIQDVTTLAALRSLPIYHEVKFSARQLASTPVLVK